MFANTATAYVNVDPREGKKRRDFQDILLSFMFIFMFYFQPSSRFMTRVNTVLINFIASFMNTYFRVWMNCNVIRDLMRWIPWTFQHTLFVLIFIVIFTHVLCLFLIAHLAVTNEDMCVSVFHWIGNYVFCRGGLHAYKTNMLIKKKTLL